MPKTPSWIRGIQLLDNGSKVFYSLPFRDPDSGEIFSNIWMQEGNSRSPITKSRQRDVDPAVSPDGQYLYFASDRLGRGRLNIWRIDLNKRTGLTKITDSPSSLSDTEPAVSPDGKRIAYTSRFKGAKVSHIWVANEDGSLATMLCIGKSPAWSPDGKQIAYVATDVQTGKDNIWVMEDNGMHPSKRTTNDQNDRYPVWTPDGTQIIYASDPMPNEENEYHYDIWIMNEDGSNPRALTLNGSYDSRPAISRDGRRLFFMSNRGAKTEGEESLQVWSSLLKESIEETNPDE